VFSRHHRKLRFLLGLSDVALTALAFELAYQTRIWMGLSFVFYIESPVKQLLLTGSALAYLFLGRWLGVHDRLDAARPSTILFETLRQCAFGAVAVVLAEFILRLDLSRVFLGLFTVYSWVLLCLFRLNLSRITGALRKKFGALHYVAVAGSGANAARLVALLHESSRFGIRLAANLSDRPSVAEISALLSRHVIDEIIFAVRSDQLAELEEIFLLCDEEGVRTRVALDFFPHVNSQVYLDRLGTAPLLTFSAAPHDELRLMAKRSFDVLLASASLIVFSPIMLFVALTIRLTSPGPAIFRQTRCGLNGRTFVFYKFRSMCRDAEQRKSELQHLNQKTTAFKISNDPRLTKVGRILRKFSIDEWPQLWNVLRGDMSLVGPRPAVPEEVEQYKRWQRRRLRMRPGLTCLWALNGRDSLDFDTWMKLDMEYIDNWSLTLDWKIMLRTIPQVVTGKGAN
jgi:exopolysaccharide biosynthesis polyprenyl glycosylphosphotransferase